MKGWGPKSSICPSKTRGIKLFWRDIPGFCRDIPEGPEKFEKKKFVFNFRSLILIHYGGGKESTTVVKQYGGVSETPCFPGET